MLLCGAAALLASVVCVSAPFSVAVIVLSAIFLLGLGFAVKGGKRRLLFLIPTFVVFILVSVCSLSEKAFIKTTAENLKEETVVGTVAEIECYDTAVGYVIDADKIGSQAVDCRVKVISVKGSQLSIGDRVNLRVSFEEGGISDKDDLANGIYFNGYLLKALEIKENGNFIASIKGEISDTISKYLNHREAGVMLAIGLGEKSALNNSALKSFEGAGLHHMIVVSGYHLSVLVGGLYFFLIRLKLGPKTAGVIGILSTVFLVLITGTTISALRAGLTFIIMFIGLMFNRRIDPINALFLSMTIIILHSPFAPFSISFQLSFAATLGVLLVAPLAKERGEGALRNLLFEMRNLLMFSIAAVIMALPITIWHFGEAGIISVLSNFVITLPVSWLLLIMAMAVIFCFIPPISTMLLLIAGLLAKFILSAVDLLGNLPLSRAFFERGAVASVFLLALTVGFVISCFIKYDKLRKKQKEEQKNARYNRIRFKKES